MGTTDERNMEEEAKSLLTSKQDETTAKCDWCGRMYTARPYLCLCRSNAFLQLYQAPPAGEQKEE